VTAVPLLCHFVSGNNWKHLNTKKESQCDYTHLISKYYINALSFATLGKEYWAFGFGSKNNAIKISLKLAQ
jgi:hypothetical protein